MSADPTQPYSEPSSPLLDSLFGLILPEDRQPYFNNLVTGGFIAMDRQDQWVSALQEAECQRLVGWQLCQFKARLDDLIHRQPSGTFPVSKTRYPDMLRRILESLRNGGYPALELPWIEGKTVVDYGCGTYNPLAMGIILFANGFERVISIEPFAVHVDVAYSGALEMAKCLLANPQELNFSGIDPAILKQRVASLSFDSLREDLTKLNLGEIKMLSLGPLEFHKTLGQLTDVQCDLLTSNSVLEHVNELDGEIALQRRLLKDGGLCVHTVDFSDHRAIGRNLHIFGMYYDDNLDDTINGLRPSEVEEIFARNGFSIARNGDLKVGLEFVDRARLTERYRPFSDDDLTTWVRTYLLQPT